MTNKMNPIAKWQKLIAEHFGLMDVLKMTYHDARTYLALQGFRLVFANTVPGLESGMLYVAIVEGPEDWIAFITEAAAEWRRNVKRFTLIMYGRDQIESILKLGDWREGKVITQQDARLIAGAAIFTRTSGQSQTIQ